MATRKPKDTDVGLSFTALQLLAPPLRLVSAALWKVLKQRDVMQYGVVEEFVTQACDTVPGLLTVRHQGRLALGLRGRLILELLQTQRDVKVIKLHMKRIRAPAAPSSSLAAAVRKDVKISKTVESFHLFVYVLLTDPAERERFFKEDFPVEYGPKFNDELEKLLWEFLIRLDQLLPVPNLAQTVSWLSDAPTVLEECARSATQPQLLSILLQHQTCLGHLEPAASLPPNMGDSILNSLSLLPSGRVNSNQGGAKTSAGGQSSKEKTPCTTPVIGLVSNEDAPVMVSASKRALRGEKHAASKDATNEHLKNKESLKFTVIRKKPKPNYGVKEGEEQLEGENGRGTKRKQPDNRQSESNEEEEEEDEDGVKQGGGESEACRTQLGVRRPHPPDGPSLADCCLRTQPRVVIERLPVASASANRAGGGGRSFYKKENQRRRPPDKALMHKSTGHQLECSDSESKENLLLSSGSPHQRPNTGALTAAGGTEDYVADSEDEATKNFKGRLFTKRYYKTKHGTYVPTLREYWKPGVARRDLLSTGSKRR